MDIITFNLVSDVFTIAIMCMLAVYHISLYQGRHQYIQDRSVLYFSIFIFFIAGYIFTRTICKYLNIMVLLVPIEAFFITIGLSSMARFFYISLNRPFKQSYIFVLDAIFLICFLMSLTSLTFGFEWYYQILFRKVINLYIIGFLLISVTTGFFIVKQKSYKEKYINIIFSGFFFLMLYLGILKLFISVDVQNILARNHLFVGILSLIFSYALAVKMNKEYKDLLLVNEKEGLGNLHHSWEERANEFSLTSREKQIVKHVSQGLEYKEIANNLNISTRTVIRHIQNVFSKVSARNKVEMLNKIFL
jgi:DNA-binding CsgD family transcriptional regulator